MDIIKPNNENRTFEYYTLKNNIKCIFINDDTLDKSYIVASVNVGSLANKEYYEGMAHLLEHMCFITSKKYKEKNYLNRMVSEAGGSTNAFTDEQNTIYYLDMFTDKLEEILEIFIDFLTNAELKEEYILAEIKSVNSEHKKNIHDDQWRFMNLEKMLADKNNNYNGFYTGSTETLNKPDIYEKILDFYNKYYISNNISICIASNKSIKDIKKIANPHLSSIPKSTKILNKYLIKPIYNSNIGKTFQMKAEGEIKLLAYKFETPNGIYNSKIFNLLTNILNSPEENLCSDHLKSLGYITFFSAEYDDLNGLFIIRIYLSKNGLKNIIYINSFIEYAINQILLFDWKKIFDYNKIKYNFLFNNLNKIDTLDLCIDLLLLIKFIMLIIILLK
jgi:secreted Zn-dependent insulinase-like peptidase